MASLRQASIVLPMTTLNPNSAVAIVTGHSRGIGDAVAAHLLSRGARVLGVSRHQNDELARRFPTTLQQVALDVADAASLKRWLASGAMKQFVNGDATPLLVNNAGVLQPIGPMVTQEVDSVIRAVAVNVGAVLSLSAAFTQSTNEAHERRILHVSSGAARK